MPKKIVDHSVIVHRNGESVVVPPNTLFDFTKEELADIERAQPDSVRNARNEDPSSAADVEGEGEAEVEEAPVETKKSTGKKSAASSAGESL